MFFHTLDFELSSKAISPSVSLTYADVLLILSFSLCFHIFLITSQFLPLFFLQFAFEFYSPFDCVIPSSGFFPGFILKS